MENQNEIVLKINRDEIYFSCKGYSEEFINTISDIINQKRRSLTGEVVGQAEESRPAEIENKKTKTDEPPSAVKAIDKREARRAYQREYGRKNKDKIYARKKERKLAKKKEEITENNGQELTGDKKLLDAAGVKTNNQGLKTKHEKGFSSPTLVSNEDKLKIAEDIKFGLFSRQILKKYHINIKAYSEIKKSIEKQKHTCGEDGLKDVKKRNAVDINNIQEKMHGRKSFGPLSANPEVRDWQKDMIARGL